MNRIYRIIWSKALRTWVVASEIATRDGKGGGGADERTCATSRQRSIGLRSYAVAISLALSAPVWAADRYWDVNGTGVGLGGTGIWNASSLIWNPSSDGVSGPMAAWNNAAAGGDNAFFMGTPGTVTLAGPVNVHDMTFGVGGYTLTGSTLTLTGPTSTINANAGTTTIESTIAGSTGFTKAGGSGILTLTGNNTFTGDIAVTGGRLILDDDAALGAAGNGVSLAAGARLDANTALDSSRLVTLLGGTATATGGALSARFTGAGNLNLAGTITNDANDYTGQTGFSTGTFGFTSIRNLGEASSLGAPTDPTLGTVRVSAGGGLGGSAVYSGDGDSSNRGWLFINTSSGGNLLRNAGTGKLSITGDIAAAGAWTLAMNFNALTADMDLLGVISSSTDRTIAYTGGSANRTIALGDANTYTGASSINNVTVRAGTLNNIGSASSFGTGTGGGLGIVGNGVLSYTGAATSTDRAITIDGNGTFANDGTGSVALNGAVGFAPGGVDTFTLGGSYAGTNTLAGAVTTIGNVVMNGAGSWLLSGANTYSGTTTVQNGTLVAGSTQAFGASRGLIVDGGTLDLNDFDITAPSLAGTGGIVDLGSGTLTVNAASGSTNYAGNIAGTGGLTKIGASTLTLSGQNTYTGDTSIGGGTLALNFADAGAPAGNIIAAGSTLNLGGGTLNITGADGEANSQTFDGLNVTAGSNTLRSTSGAGGSMTVNVGAITHSGGIVNFVAPTSGVFNTSNADGALGGWATVTNGTTTDYAEVVGGQIVAFDDYTDQDNASLWLDGQFISDEGGAPNTSYFNTVTGSKQIAGLKYTAAQNSTVTVGAGQTLGLDGTIIVNSTTNNATQTIQGGSLTGAVGGGTLGVLKNSDGFFVIDSNVVDNGGAVGFTVGGTGGTGGNGTVSLTGDNTYTGATTVSGATLLFDSVANGGSASALGASSNASSNLVLENGRLRYTGGTASTDRGFTLVNGGASRAFEISDAGANLTFTGLVTSPDDAGFNKVGAGTLTLANGGNDYIGVTDVSAGTLSVNTLADGGAASGIGASSNASSNLIIRTGGVLQYTGATASSDRGFTLDGSAGGSIDVGNAATTLTLGGVAVGNAKLTKQGAGTLVLSGVNTYTGQTVVDGGTLRAGSTQAFGGPNLVTLADAAGVALDLDGFDNRIGGLQGGGAIGGNVLLGSGTLTIAGNNATFGGAISGTGGIIKDTSSTQAMLGCGNSYTGPTTLRSGTFTVDCLADSGLQSGIGASSDVTGGLVFNGGRLAYTGGTVAVDRGFTTTGGFINVTQAGTTLTLSGAAVGTGTLSKEGAGTLVLSGANTYSGTTQISEGTLRAGSAQAIGSSGLRMGLAGTLFDLGGFDTSAFWIDDSVVNADAPSVGNIALGGNTLTITNGAGAIGNGAAVNYAGVISGTGGIVKNGGSLQQFSGCNNTYTGSTTINGGWLMVDCLADGGLNSGLGASSSAAANLVLNGGRLRYLGSGGSTDRQFTVGAGNGWLEAYGTGAIHFTSTAPVVFSGSGNRTLVLGGINTDDNSLAARIDNAAGGTTAFIKEGTGTWILNNAASTYTGRTTISGGVLGVDKLSNGGVASSIGMSTSGAGNLVIGNNSTLRYTGAGDTTDRLFTLSTGVSFIESSGTGAIVFSNTGSAGFSAAGARTLALGGTNTGLNTMGGTIVDQNAAAGKTTLAKNDSGTWVLTGNNSYSGNTVINDGNLIVGNGGTSGNAGTGNVIVVNSTSTLSFNRSDTFNFSGELSGAGNIAQMGTGTTVLTAANNTIGGVTGVNAGTLQIAGGSNLTTGAAAMGNGTLQVQAGGSLTTPTIAMNAGSTLDVSGTVQAAGGAASAMTGDAGDSTINVNAGGTLRANGDLGGGSDTVNLFGMLDTGSGVLGLGAGDDLLALNEGASIAGGVAAGAGADTLQVNNTSAMTLGGADYTGFESLIKQNSGALTLTGGHNYSAGVQLQGGTLNAGAGNTDSLIAPAVTMANDTVLNVNGILQGAGGTTAVLTGSTGINTINVASGGMLVATGDLGAGSDTVFLSGTLNTGPGTLNLGSADDIVTLYDGAVLAGSGIDAGAQVVNDTLVLENASALSFDGSKTAGFEQLIKRSTGTATMTGSQSFANNTAILAGTLDIDGDLTTPQVYMDEDTTLIVDGSLQGAGGTAAAISVADGEQVVTVNGTAALTGDLGVGNDTLDVSGTLDILGSVFNLGDGDDNFLVHDGTVVNGTIDGGAGLDSRTYDINTTADLGTLLNFEGVTKTGTGTLNINGPGATDLQGVQVLGGTLNIGAGASVVATAGSALHTVVGSGATLSVDGSFGCGSQNDTMSVSAAVTGGGTIDLCGGDDVLTVNDGADFSGFAGTISGGAGIVGDSITLNNAAALSFGPVNLTGFEFLEKENTGEATLIGSQSYSGGVGIGFNGGILTVGAGATLATPTVVAANGTTFNVAGSLQGLAAGSAANVLGDAGAQAIHITGTALATGNLGGGNDTLDVSGTLDVAGGVFNLGDGDDNFVIHDGTQIIGTIDGGAGLDSRTYDINTTADLGALLNFEGVTKTGTGTLNINGPGATDLQEVEVLGGTLNVGAAASVVGKPGESLSTVVGAGATLNVNGQFGCSAGDDTMTVSGMVSGTGTVNLCDGNDTLTLNDGVVLANTIDGGAQSTADRVVLNNAGSMMFGGGNTVNFEILQKDNIGAATLVGTSIYTGGTLLNAGVLTVAGDLSTPTLAMADNTTLNVDGSLQGTGGATAITGSGGTNTVTVAGGATLTATGDLGDGNDTLDVIGTVDTDGGVFSLGAGDDTFNIYDATDASQATIDGGMGNDTLDANIGAGSTASLGSLLGFESLGKSGLGTLEIHGASSFIDVDINDGVLRMTGTGSIAANNTTILSGATLELADGAVYGGTAGNDTFTVAGTVVSTGAPNTGRIDLGAGDDTFTLQDGANLSGLAPEPVSGGAGTDTFVADLAGNATLGGAVDFETLTKTNIGTLVVAGPAASSFSTVNVEGGLLDIGIAGSIAGVRNATVASGATLNIDGAFGFTAGADQFTVAGTVTGTSAIDMLDGDDTFTIQDGADLSGLAGPVDGGAGNDTFVSDIAGTATLGGAVNFETLNKTGIGTLVVAGAAASAFTAVNVAGGTLDIGVNGAIDGVVAGTVANGTTLNVDGRYSGSAGNDSLTVAGAVSGSGDIALGDGDDVLTLEDGADLGGLAGAIDGGIHGTGDRVVLNNAAAMDFDADNVANFEFLQKDNAGEATLTGTASFGGGTALNGGTLTVAGDLSTPTVAMGGDTMLNVDGHLEGTGGSAAAITGGAGVQTVNIAGTAIAAGDLGAGNDVLDVAGMLDTDGGTFALGDGDDDFVVHDGTVVLGTIDGGAGMDSRVYDINGTAAFGALANFEGVTKRGSGTLNISGPGATDLQNVEVEGGTLNIDAAASVVATAGTTLNTVVADGATLNVDGSFGCGAGNDTMTVAGTVSGSGVVAMCGGDDTLTLQDGATLAAIVDGGADTDTVMLDTTTAMIFDAAQTTNFESLQKEGAGGATLNGAASFTSGTSVNEGTLIVAGSLTTPTVALADGTTLDVDGSLQGASGAATLTGSAGVNRVNVAGTLLATGDLGAGDDVLDVSGTLDIGTGTFSLGDGNDTLTIHDGTNIVGTVVAGAGNDTFNTDIATNADLGAVQGFETLSKTGAGTLDINGPASSDFSTVNINAGTLNVASGGSIEARNSSVAAGATLQIAGKYSGTAGDDSFTSMGTVRGALAFGAGNDTARFVGGDISGLIGANGGAGDADLISFSGLDLDDGNAAGLAGWERVELLNDSALNLGTSFLPGVLAIDGSSRLAANAGASIVGSVENAGSIEVGANRLAISGGYSANGGALTLTVSPGSAASGGLDIAGDVTGTTRVIFASDGSSPAAGTSSIRVISSPNDDLATAGEFAPDSADGAVRLDGSPFAWEFGQQGDRSWYLTTGEGGTDVLPEIAGYGALPGLGALMSQRGDDLAHQRLAGARGAERPRCGEARNETAGNDFIDDCRGVWVATSATEVELGADPGFEVTGDDTGLYVGIDGIAERERSVLRGGAYLGYMHSVYWATGVNSSAVAGMGPARIDLDTPIIGLYGTSEWNNGNYVDLVLSGQRPRAEVRTADGFADRIDADTLTLSARYGHRYRLDNGWMLEPQLQLSGSRVRWDDRTDAAGRQLAFDDDLVASARAALRVEKTIATAGGAQIRPWATLAVQNAFAGKDNGLRVAQSGVAPSAFPGHDLGTSANLDVGVEAAIDRNVSFFGVISIGQDLQGSDYEQRGMNLGMRVRW